MNILPNVYDKRMYLILEEEAKVYKLITEK